MTHSLCIPNLTESQQQTFRELGIEEGDRIYVRKLRPLSDTDLAQERQRHLRQEVDARGVVRPLARVFDRNHKTIARRLRKLPIPTGGDPS